MKGFFQMCRQASQAPSLLILTLVLMLASNYVRFRVFGYSFSGWSWLALLAWSFLILAGNVRRTPALPIWIWAPWGLFAIVSAFHGHEYGWQSTAQILCPLFVGIAASTCPMDMEKLKAIHALIRLAFLAFLASFVVIVAPYALADAGNSGFATVGISSLIFQSYFLASYLRNGRRNIDLAGYASAALIPLLTVNRGPLMAATALLVFGMTPISVARRVQIALVAAVLAFGAFHTEKVQRKMFYSGQGELTDLRWENPDLNTSGRAPMWSALSAGVGDAPLLGHGANADRTYLLGLGFPTYLPHNDWLRMLYNYGFVGTALLLLTFAAQIANYSSLKIRSEKNLHILGAAGASCFVPFAILMCTDNVIIYCQYFSVPMMVMLGLTYRAAQTRREALRRQDWSQPATVAGGAVRASLRPVLH